MKKLENILHFKNLLVLIYLIFVLANMLFFVSLNQNDIDTISNKTKTPFPEYDSTGLDGYMQNIEKHYVDYFPFRYKYISISNFFKVKLFNNLNANNNVVVGKKGWLFYNACIFDEIGMNEYTGNNAWTKEEVAKVMLHLSTIDNWCKRHQIKFEIIFCPNKQSIYGDFMPDYYIKNGKSRLDQLIKSFPNIINIKNLFINYRKKTNYPLYYMTDTHWNYLGGYLVCNELNKKWKNQFPLKNFNKIKLTSSIVDNGYDLANMLALKDNYKEIDVNIEFKELPVYKIPNLIVVHDSYLTFMEPSLNYMFQKVTKRHLYQDGIPSPDELLKEKPDVFMIELVERYKEMMLWDIHPDFYK